MPSYRFEVLERLGLLAAFALDVLDEEFTEAELDRDDHPPRTDLYNLASGLLEWVEERRLGDKPIMGHDRDQFADELLNDLVEQFGDTGRTGHLWARLTPRAEA